MQVLFSRPQARAARALVLAPDVYPLPLHWSARGCHLRSPCCSLSTPFSAPRGAFAVLITVVPVAVSIAYAAIITTESFFSSDELSSEKQSHSDGGLPPIFQVVSMVLVILLGGLVHLFFSLRDSCTDAHGRLRMHSNPPLAPAPARVPCTLSDTAMAPGRDAHSGLCGGSSDAVRVHSLSLTSDACGGCSTVGASGGGSEALAETMRSAVSNVYGSIGGRGKSKEGYQQVGCTADD